MKLARRTAVAGALLALSTAVVVAQNRHKVEINAETPEGQLLQQIGQEQDAAKKTALMEQFAQKHASHNSYAWVLGHLVPIYGKANQPDKVFPAVEQLLKFDPADAEMAYEGLKAAVAKNDYAAIIKWAGSTTEAAKKALALPEPKEEDEVEQWKYKQAFSKPDQVQKRAEYEVFTAILRTQDPAQRIQLMDGLRQLNPNSEYGTQFDANYFISYRQLGQNDKAMELAAQAAAKGTADEDMLLLLSNNSFEKKDPAKVVEYSDKLVELLKTKPVPQGANPADWEKKKNTQMGAGLWLKGMTLAAQSKWPETDGALRAALPMLEGNDQLLGPALFNLGLANFKMGEKGPKGPNIKLIQEALGFNQKCAAIKGPMQAQAAKNVTVIKQNFKLR